MVIRVSTFASIQRIYLMKMMPKLVNLKVSELRKNGYKDVSEWLSDPKHLYIGRRMRIFIHTGIETSEESGTRVAMDENEENAKILIRPSAADNSSSVPFDEKLLSYPAGPYVNKKKQIVHYCIIPQSEWHNPFKVKKSNKRQQVVSEYEEYLMNNESLMKKLSHLGQYSEIGCWCTPKDCYGDCILSQYRKLTKIKTKNKKKRASTQSMHGGPLKRRNISSDK